MTAERTVVEWGRFSIGVPSKWTIKKPLPSLYAEARGQRLTLVVQVDPDDGVWRAMEDIVAGPIGANSPMITTQVLRRGNIERPFAGREIVAEHFTPATAVVSCLWQVNVADRGLRVAVILTGMDTFASCEAGFRAIVDSLTIRPAE